MQRLLTLAIVVAGSTVLLAQAAAPAPKPPAPAASKPAPPKAPATGAVKPAAPKTTGGAAAARPAAPATPAPAAAIPVDSLTDDQKTIYALGLALEGSIHSLGFSPEEMAIIARGMADAAAEKPGLKLEEWGPRIDPFAQVRRQGAVEREKTASAAFIDRAAALSGAARTSSGVVYRELRPGIGPMPKATDTVKVHYRGTLRNGEVFDSSYDRNEPVTFSLGGVIACWTDGLQMMRVGGKAEFYCPSFLAYGDRGNDDIPGGAALRFEVDLLEIVKTP
jgi:FKBP-type peptidyl-prolyl cis-trans isomerase FkpA